MITIKLCPSCEGSGKKENYGIREWATCTKCNGDGRVIEVSAHSVSVPYNQMDLAKDLEDKMIKVVRGKGL
jgi:DnaJ-class molecular chaperone